MSRRIKASEVSKNIDIGNGLRVVLLNKLALEHLYDRVECARNIFMVNVVGEVIWQVASDFDADGDPFTNVIYSAGRIQGYRWDGFMYEIDFETGRAIPGTLMK